MTFSVYFDSWVWISLYNLYLLHDNLNTRTTKSIVHTHVFLFDSKTASWYKWSIIHCLYVLIFKNQSTKVIMRKHNTLNIHSLKYYIHGVIYTILKQRMIIKKDMHNVLTRRPNWSSNKFTEYSLRGNHFQIHKKWKNRGTYGKIWPWIFIIQLLNCYTLDYKVSGLRRYRQNNPILPKAASSTEINNSSVNDG